MFRYNYLCTLCFWNTKRILVYQ